jgi:type II secretory pathway component PulJ
MNKLSKIFLVIIIVLVLALCIMSYLYVNMRRSSKQNLDSLLTKSQELTNAYQRIDELEERLKCIDKQFKDCAWRLRELTKE